MSVITIGPRNINDARAAKTVAGFQRKTGADEQGALIDLLCALMLWSDRGDGDFEDAAVPASITRPRPPRAPAFQSSLCGLKTGHPTRRLRWFPTLSRVGNGILTNSPPSKSSRTRSCVAAHAAITSNRASRTRRDVWTVIGRYRSGGMEPCQNFTTGGKAQAFLDGLIAAHSHLAPVQN